MSVCGEWAFYHVPSDTLKRWFCGSGSCHRVECHNLFWSSRVKLISALIREYGLIRFFTLTLDREYIPQRVNPWNYIHEPWTKLRKRMNRRHDFKFVSILEAHKNKQYPHIHGFTNVWQHQRVWSSMWNECSGGRIVWVEKVEEEGLSEYVSKSLEVAKYVGKENLIKGYKQKGNHRTLWRSKGLRAKYELTKSEEWCMVKEKVFNENGDMSDFYSKKGIWDGSKKKQKRKDMEGTCRPVLE